MSTASRIPSDGVVPELRAAAQILRDGNTWIGRGLRQPLADLLDAAADHAADAAPDDLATIPVVVRALAVAGVVTGRPSLS